ncbi:Transglutaminase-like enzyme, putative cysteine protease [Cognatiyoonia koreensis]|uniref:Transglutaminase-like enzyme, putative cysteine protease n=1 Tax=Cognatiyoonia koreensis TaxID=364200 RepID=A0A1I0MKS5_9RHOB|nr:transglutaminase family protein [Cognatiyoonia koreensis]SEV88480.1 Transglutaminase-like enzyme, putative cysteine protease [Cognatiyoonia koreensis]
MPLSITHTTRYTYDQPVSYALQKVRLRPQSNPLQEVIRWDLSIDGGRIETSYRDHYGNHVDLVSADIDTQEMTITATGEVEVKDRAGVLGMVYGRAPLWHFTQETPLTTAGPLIAPLAKIAAVDPVTTEVLHALSAAILEAVPYQAGQTHAGTSAEEAMTLQWGVCQDHSHIFLAAARHAGIAARYVSGYLHMTDRVDQDASHAWVEAHVPDLGWVGFDISNGISPDERYVRLAVGRDAQDAAPISGLRMGSGDETMIVSLQVQQ